MSVALSHKHTGAQGYRTLRLILRKHVLLVACIKQRRGLSPYALEQLHQSKQAEETQDSSQARHLHQHGSKADPDVLLLYTVPLPMPLASSTWHLPRVGSHWVQHTQNPRSSFLPTLPSTPCTLSLSLLAVVDHTDLGRQTGYTTLLPTFAAELPCRMRSNGSRDTTSIPKYVRRYFIVIFRRDVITCPWGST